MKNMFAGKSFLPGASEKEFQDKEVGLAAEIFAVLRQIPDLPQEVPVYMLLAGAVIGTRGHEDLNEKEKNLITSVFGVICNAPPEAVLQLVKRPLDDSSYEIVRDLFRISPECGLAFCNFILCFAYVDGVFEPEPAEQLTAIIAGYMNISETDGEQPPAQPAPETALLS